jgi:lysophospholipase L1-like esterase
MKKKEWVVNLSLVIAGILVFLLISELALMIFVPHLKPTGHMKGIFFEHDSTLGWKGVPNATGVFSTEAFTMNITLNSKGLRDTDDYSYNNENVTRIVVLGDSFTWGEGVNNSQIYTEFLENKLDKAEVINTGHVGYSTAQELLFLKYEGVKYSPDLVILLFCKNDLTDNVATSTGYYPRPVFAIDENNNTFLTNVPLPEISLFGKIKAYLTYHSHLSYFVYERLERSMSLQNIFAPMGLIQKRYASDEKEIQYNWRLEYALLNEINNISNNNLIIIAISDEGNNLSKFCNANEIYFLNLQPEFEKQSSKGKQLLIPIDLHWNEAGHRLATELIYNKLIEEKLVPVGGTK